MSKVIPTLVVLLVIALTPARAQDVTHSGKVSINTTDSPKEALQIGDRFTFHDGGTKVLGYNFFFDGRDRRLVEAPVSMIRFEGDGSIRLRTALKGVANSAIDYDSEGLILTNAGQLGLGIQDPQALLHVQDLYPAGGRNLQIGNDTYFSDIDVGNRLGLFGVQDPQMGALQLGSNGPVLSGRNGRLGVGVDSPSEVLDIAGNLRLSGSGSVSKIVSPHDICIGNCQ